MDDIKDNKNNNIRLDIENKLEDFFVEDNWIGITYKNIYKKFIKIQNEKLEPLLDIKLSKGLLIAITKLRLIFNILIKEMYLL